MLIKSLLFFALLTGISGYDIMTKEMEKKFIDSLDKDKLIWDLMRGMFFVTMDNCTGIKLELNKFPVLSVGNGNCSLYNVYSGIFKMQVTDYPYRKDYLEYFIEINKSTVIDWDKSQCSRHSQGSWFVDMEACTQTKNTYINIGTHVGSFRNPNPIDGKIINIDIGCSHIQTNGTIDMRPQLHTNNARPSINIVALSNSYDTFIVMKSWTLSGYGFCS